MILLPSGGTSKGPAAPDAHRRVALLLVARQSALAPRMTAHAHALAAALPAGWTVASAVRDGPQAIAAAIRDVARCGADELVVVPLHPQFGTDLSGAIVTDLYGALAREAPQLNVAVRTCWHDDAGYVNAVARWIADQVTVRGVDPAKAFLRFTLPLDAGPVGLEASHLRRTAELVVERLGWRSGRWSLAWPDTPEVFLDQDDTGVNEVLECPLPFPAAEGLSAPMLDALRGVVLHGAQPAPDSRAAKPLLHVPAAGCDHDESLALFMIGASLANGVGPGRGPAIRYSDSRAFARVKRSRKALRSCLDWARTRSPLTEAFIWNTCQRLELYGWIPCAIDPTDRASLLTDIHDVLFEHAPDGLEVNVLHDRAAWHHLMRTVCGLNSGLPGDRDVAAQLQTALRTAQCARTAGPRAIALVEDALALARDAHGRTTWGRFSTGFCAAALARICEVDGLRPDRFRHVVIGGSTTSRSILTTLVEEHGVPHRQLTLIYRDHHGQMKQLRAALGMGRRLRVHAYGEEAVLRAIADADLVYFGIDQAEPVLDDADLGALRDYGARPLTLVDFNSFGSVRSPDGVPGITQWSAKELDEAVAAHAAVTITRSGFASAVTELEEEILRRRERASAIGVDAPPPPSPASR